VGTTYNNMANVYERQGKYVDALEYHNKALDIYLQVHGTDHPSVGDTYVGIANVYNSQGKYGDALEYYKKDLVICLQVHGTDHPSVGGTYMNMASTYQGQGKYVDALEYHNKALVMKLQVHGTDHPSVGDSYYNIGILHMDQGDNVQAFDLFERALGIQLPALGADHPLTKNTKNAITWINNNKEAARKLDHCKTTCMAASPRPEHIKTFPNIAAICEYNSDYAGGCWCDQCDKNLLEEAIVHCEVCGTDFCSQCLP
jgi:tetratricopeptide (TPR) repeat protein